MSLPLPQLDRGGIRDPQKCAACGGKCCAAQPGTAWPEDFDGDLARIVDAIRSGTWAIHCTKDGAPLWVRPATVRGRREGRAFDRDLVGRCSMLAADGCTLAWNDRPAQCRWLEPIEYGKCKGDGKHTNANAVKAWAPLMPQIVAALNQHGHVYQMPDDFDVEAERRRLIAGGCCGAPSGE